MIIQFTIDRHESYKQKLKKNKGAKGFLIMEWFFNGKGLAQKGFKQRDLTRKGKPTTKPIIAAASSFILRLKQRTYHYTLDRIQKSATIKSEIDASHRL